MSADGLKAAAAKMEAAGQPEEAVRAFSNAYRRLAEGQAVMLASAALEPADDVPALEDLPAADNAEALERVALIKLNGGLATTMGLRRPTVTSSWTSSSARRWPCGASTTSSCRLC